MIGRYGGDEFVIALQATADQGLAIAKRLAAEIKKNPMKTSSVSLTLAVSVGVAGAPERQLFEAAESALRVAKVKGRNLCVLFDKSMQGAQNPKQPVDVF